MQGWTAATSHGVTKKKKKKNEKDLKKQIRETPKKKGFYWLWA